jgi:putative restriction endonuclease
MPDVDEVNFWTPNPWGGRFRVLDRGQPLLFKLRASEGGWIVGGGFFEHYTDLPISLAWDAFGEKNGAPSVGAVRERIARLRHDDTDPWAEYTIGCIVLVEPFFFSRDEWIPPPGDWAPNIVRGRRYDLTDSPGRELWDEVVLRLQTRDRIRDRSLDGTPGPVPPGGFGDPQLHRPRLGQGAFRVLITDLYGRQCAVTRERALPALEAAHIRPFSERPIHEIRNGLLLRSDVHRLLDAGYVTVTPQHRVEVSGRMHDDFDDGKNYLRLHGRTIVVPERSEHQPDPAILRWHNENRFRG